MTAPTTETKHAPEAVEAVARAIWNVRREEEDRCDMELEDMGSDHSVWDEALAAIEATSNAETKRDGGPAFPICFEGGQNNGESPFFSEGMSVRDQFAMHALGLGFDWTNVHETGGYAEAAAVAYEVADAMLAARAVQS